MGYKTVGNIFSVFVAECTYGSRTVALCHTQGRKQQIGYRYAQGKFNSIQFKWILFHIYWKKKQRYSWPKVNKWDVV